MDVVFYAFVLGGVIALFGALYFAVISAVERVRVVDTDEDSALLGLEQMR